MNNFKKIKKGLLFMLATLSFTSCVHDDDYGVPPIETILPCENNWKANTTIADLIALTPNGEPVKIENDLILEGYVVSSDEKGNFFKSLVIQNDVSNPTYGMTIEADLVDTYRKFPVGYKVLVNAKGLYFGRDKGTYKIGTTYKDDNGNVRLGRMTEVDAIDKVSLSCDDATEINPVTFTSIQDLKDNAVVNTLIKLENVQFKDVKEGDTYYEEGGSNTFGGATNRTLEDKDGKKIVLRTSKYTDFAGEVMPTGSGTIIAVLSAYATNNNPTPSTYQLFIRSVEDVDMNNPRLKDTDNTGGGTTNDLTYLACVNQDFESYSGGADEFTGYHNISAKGDRKWYIKSYDNNKYIQMSSYKSNEENEGYFVVPVDFDKADTVSFDVNLRYYNGDALTVYYSQNYKSADDMGNLTDITSKFTIPSADTNNLIPAGSFDFNGLSGKGAIIFKYTGKDGGTTTTVQLDNIKITDNENNSCQ